MQLGGVCLDNEGSVCGDCLKEAWSLRHNSQKDSEGFRRGKKGIGREQMKRKKRERDGLIPRERIYKNRCEEVSVSQM